ncbi:MAG: hypothetical protein HOP11_03695 [Saprospiraceae bacterium]|nr:hypothetical protein [Saprospiraceae bacterium]
MKQNRIYQARGLNTLRLKEKLIENGELKIEYFLSTIKKHVPEFNLSSQRIK